MEQWNVNSTYGVRGERCGSRGEIDQANRIVLRNGYMVFVVKDVAIEKRLIKVIGLYSGMVMLEIK